MGICGRLLSLYRREEPVVDKRGKAILANGELHIIKFSPHLRVRVSVIRRLLYVFFRYMCGILCGCFVCVKVGLN